MMQEELRRKLIEIESSLGLLQHDFDQQNEMILHNSKRLDRIERILAQLVDRVSVLQPPDEPRTLEDEKPPHY